MKKKGKKKKKERKRRTINIKKKKKTKEKRKKLHIILHKYRFFYFNFLYIPTVSSTLDKEKVEGSRKGCKRRRQSRGGREWMGSKWVRWSKVWVTTMTSELR